MMSAQSPVAGKHLDIVVQDELVNDLSAKRTERMKRSKLAASHCSCGNVQPPPRTSSSTSAVTFSRKLYRFGVWSEGSRDELTAHDDSFQGAKRSSTR